MFPVRVADLVDAFRDLLVANVTAKGIAGIRRVRDQATVADSLGRQGLEPYASWQKLPPDALIKPFNNPRAIQVVVTGGDIQTTWFVTDFRLGRGVLVDDWR